MSEPKEHAPISAIIKEKQAKYVEARLAGAEPREAADAAGYSKESKIVEIERPGSGVSNAIQKALLDKGIDDKFLADEYAKGIKRALEDGAADSVDCGAHAKYLLQLSYLKGYGKSGPAVAVQINNTPANSAGAQGVDLGRIEETLRETRDVLELVRAELGQREASPVHAEDSGVAGGDQLHPRVGPHPGVGEVGGDSRQAGGGSQS